MSFKSAQALNHRNWNLLLGDTGAVTPKNDPYYNNVILLLHGDGVVGSGVVTDDSPLHQVPSFIDRVTVSNAVPPPYGSTSLITGVAPSFVRWHNPSVFDFGSGDFTIELWFRPFSLSSTRACMISWVDSGALVATAWLIDFQNGASPDLAFSVTGVSIASTIPMQLGWHFYTMCRQGNIIYAYIDGVLVGSAVKAGALYVPTTYDPVIFRRADSGEQANGYIKDVRLTKGVCRYPNGLAFSPPTSEFPNM